MLVHTWLVEAPCLFNILSQLCQMAHVLTTGSLRRLLHQASPHSWLKKRTPLTSQTHVRSPWALLVRRIEAKCADNHSKRYLAADVTI